MGAAIARQFAVEGAALVLNDLSARRLEQSAGAAAAAGAAVAALRGDITRRQDAEALVALAASRFGRVDILVNVVGGVQGAIFKPFLEMSEADWDGTLALNLKGTFLLTQLAAQHMLRRQYGRVVNIASAAYGGSRGQAAYSAAKAGVVAFTRTVAWELAPHVAVNCVAPGLVRTSIVDRLTDAEKARLVAAVPQGRMGEPAEVARTVAFLASDEASHITGEVIVVAGGLPASL